MKNDLHIQFSSFAGPLDLLLSLIDEKKMEISEVSISSVTEGFLAHLDTLEETEAEELADFLVIAAKLLFLKSKNLLLLQETEEDEGISLEDQLKLYREFVKASKSLNEKWMSGKIGYERIEPPRIPKEIPLPENLTVHEIQSAIERLLERIKPPKPLPETRIDRTVSLKETVARLRTLLDTAKKTSFKQWIPDSASRTEIIVGFLALLELVKQKEIDVKQSEAFSDIAIAKL